MIHFWIIQPPLYLPLFFPSPSRSCLPQLPSSSFPYFPKKRHLSLEEGAWDSVGILGRGGGRGRKNQSLPVTTWVTIRKEGHRGFGQPRGRAPVTRLPAQCGTLSEVGPNENLTERSLQDAQRLFLMSEAVQPVTPEPCVTQDSVRFSHLVVDLVQAQDTLYHVLYIGTGEPDPGSGLGVGGV